jgi:hypothetical protein
MTTRSLLTVAIFAISFCNVFADIEYSKLSGRDLIQLLLKPETKSQAYHELALRNDPEAEKEFTIFDNKHRNPEVIECPQPNGRPPIYAVLSDFLSHISEQSGDEEIHHESQEAKSSSPFERKRELLIDVFTFDGRKINPFECNDNVLDGIMMDMNGDGFIERASQIRYRVEGVENTVVLNVNRMGEHEEPVLSVMFNWGTEEDWDFTFSDRDHDGLVEIDFGPFTDSGVLPEVTFRWDKIQKEYILTTSVFQNHLIVLDHKKAIWDELARVKKEVQFFPKDSRAVSEFDRQYYQEGKLPPEKEEEAKIVSTEYAPKSLKGMTDEEIFTYMGRGKTLFDIKDEESPRTTIPEEFWNVPPKEAALLILEANRSQKHRSKYKVTIGSDKYAETPESYSMAFSFSAAHSTMIPNYFLRIDPKGSYLLFSAVTNQNHYMLKTSDVCYSPPVYDFRTCAMKYEDAKHLLDTIWWLRQVETVPPGKPNDDYGLFSTADGDGTIQFISNDGSQQSFITADTGGWVSTRWTSSFGDEELVGLVAEMFFESLQDRLKPCMNGAPDWWGPRDIDLSKNDELVHKTVKRYLELFSENQKNISYTLMLTAIEAAGDLAMQDLSMQLEAIKRMLPGTITAPNCENIRDEIDKLEQKDKESTKTFNPSNAEEYLKDYDQRNKRIMSLYDQLTSIRHGAIKECALANISNAIDESLAKIRDANNSQNLKSWVNEKRPRWPWALWRLSEIDKKVYVEILQSMFSSENSEDRNDLIQLIFDADKTAGVDIARSQSADQKELSIGSLLILAKAGTSEESTQSINVLLDYVLDPATGRTSRLKILDTLVPEQNPNKFPTPKIDETLLKMLDLPPPEESYESILGSVAQCIFLRTGNKYFTEVLAHFDESNIDFDAISTFEGILPELTKQQKMKLAEKLRPLFSEGPGMIDEIVFTAWSSNLTDLRSEIENIAAGKPEDVEPDECFSGSDVGKISGRCHSARQVSALWNEKPSYTKLKMLISFYIQNAEEFEFENSGKKLRMNKLKTELLESIHKLKPSEHVGITDFLIWCDSKHPFTDYDVNFIPQREALFSFIKQNVAN